MSEEGWEERTRYGFTYREAIEAFRERDRFRNTARTLAETSRHRRRDRETVCLICPSPSGGKRLCDHHVAILARRREEKRLMFDLPGEGFVYHLFDREGSTLYIGVTGNVRQRCSSHKSKPWWGTVDSGLVECFDSYSEAHAHEQFMIFSTCPRFNTACDISRSQRGTPIDVAVLRFR